MGTSHRSIPTPISNGFCLLYGAKTFGDTLVMFSTSQLLKQNVRERLFKITRHLKRVGGIEPPSLAWKARVLPLNYTRSIELTSSFAKLAQFPTELLNQITTYSAQLNSKLSVTADTAFFSARDTSGMTYSAGVNCMAAELSLTAAINKQSAFSTVTSSGLRPSV